MKSGMRPTCAIVAALLAAALGAAVPSPAAACIPSVGCDKVVTHTDTGIWENQLHFGCVTNMQQYEKVFCRESFATCPADCFYVRRGTSAPIAWAHIAAARVTAVWRSPRGGLFDALVGAIALVLVIVLVARRFRLVRREASIR